MHQALYKYFALYHYLMLPGIGRIISLDQAPVIDVANNQITPPYSRLEIVNEIQSDEILLSFLAKELNTDKAIAKEQMQLFTSHLLEQLQLNNEVTVTGIATIFSRNGVYEATPATVALQFFPVLPVNRIIRNVNRHFAVGRIQKHAAQLRDKNLPPHQQPKDYWWVAALIILVLTVGGAVLFLMRDKLF